MHNEKPEGVLGLDYASARERKRSARYRLGRRMREVCRAIEAYGPSPVGSILDLGTAEGGMLSMIHGRFPDARCVGVEYSGELVDLGRRSYPDIEIVQGDVQALEMAEASFDVVSAAAVIEHLPEPSRLAAEAARVLRPGGILILTAPDPFWESIATKVGHLDDEQHSKVMNLAELGDLVSAAGLEVLEAEKFMISPVGMPFELAVERMLRLLRLRFLMANQIVVARKPG